MSNRFITFSLLLILLLATSPVQAVDPPNPDKPTIADLAQAGTLLRISLANASFEDDTNSPDNGIESPNNPPPPFSVTDELQATNLLSNPSFENGTDIPTNWTPLNGYIGDSYLWPSVASQGQQSVSIRGTRYFYGRWESAPIPVQRTGFSWYTLTGAVKTQESDGEVYLSIAWLDSNGDMIATADSAMLPPGDNDWQAVTVKALPPDGTVSAGVWCISNHNSGQTWFDTLHLFVTQLPAKGKGTYDQFLIEHPNSPLAIDAHLMRVQTVMTEAKWIKEADYYGPDEQKQASQLYAQAAAVARDDSVLQKAVAVAGQDFAQEKERFESLIDEALWSAALTAGRGGDIVNMRQYLSKIVERNRDAASKAAAEAWIKEIDAETKLNN